MEDPAVVDAPLLKDRAAGEAPLPKELIDLGVEDNHGIGKLDLTEVAIFKVAAEKPDGKTAENQETHDLWFTQDTHLLLTEGEGNGKRMRKSRAPELILDQSRQLPPISCDGRHERYKN